MHEFFKIHLEDSTKKKINRKVNESKKLTEIYKL